MLAFKGQVTEPIQLKGSMFVTGVKIKATVASKLNDSPVQLGGERHWKNKVSCPRTQHNVLD